MSGCRAAKPDSLRWSARMATVLLVLLLPVPGLRASSANRARPKRGNGGPPLSCSTPRFRIGAPLPIIGPTAGAIADFDGDGNGDMAIADVNGVRILFGDGTGDFRPGPVFSAIAAGSLLVAGDFDEDGRVDLISSDSAGLVLLIGDGAGGFVPGDPLPPLGVGGFPLAGSAGDFNGDGHLDFSLLAYVPFQGAVSIALGDGTGHFTGSPFGQAAGFFPTALEAADFNNDGALDLAVSVSAGVDVFLGDGIGGLSAATLHATSGLGASVGIGDLNEDGNVDLAIATSQPDGVSVLLGDGSGDFGPPRVFPGELYTKFVAVADWDQDGHLDLGVVSDFNGDLAILRGDGTGDFTPGPRKFVASRPVTALELGNLNGDGVPDLLVLSAVASAALLADGAGGFATATIYLTGGQPAAVVTADFNGDGHADLATANPESGDVSVLLGDGAGAFGPSSRFAGGATPVALVAGDFNGDGAPDLAVADSSANAVAILPGNGAGGFGSPQAFPAGGSPAGVATGDLNRDGHLDLAVANGQSGDVSVLMGDGHGAVGAPSNFVAGGSPKGVLIADFNGDGKLDLASANSEPSALSVWLGNGDGSFGLRSDFAGTFRGHALAAADLNEDGNLDIALALDELYVVLFFGDGAGGFVPGGSFTFADFIGGVGIADFNGDGHQDLVASNTAFGNFGILLGDGTGNFAGGTGYGTGGVAPGLITADFDSDARMDLGFAALPAGGVTVLLNRSFTILPVVLPPAFLLGAYTASLSEIGGHLPVTMTLAGALPAGLSFDATTATLSGVPEERGEFPISVTALDTAGCGTTRSYTLVVSGIQTLIVTTVSGGISGQPLTLTATVTSNPPGTIPTGEVVFNVDGVDQPPVPLVDGVATLTLTNLSAGIHSFSAVYSGDGTHSASSSSTVTSIVLVAAVPGLTLPGALLLGFLLAVAGFRFARLG